MWESCEVSVVNYIISASDDDLDKIIAEAEKEKARRAKIERLNSRLRNLIDQAEKDDILLVNSDSNEVIYIPLCFK